MTGFLESHAIYAIMLFGVLQAMCIPISSELTFLVGGAVASGAALGTGPVPLQHPQLWQVIVLGTLAEMVGSFIAYGVGRAGGRPLVHRWGRYVLVTQNDVDRAERFLVGRGVWALPVARMLPFVRAFASLVAGIVEIPPVRFGILNLIGTVVYVTALSWIGYSLGGAYKSFSKNFTDASYVIIGLIVLALIVVVIHRLREFRRETAYSSKHGGTPQVRSDRDRSARLCDHRARRRGAGRHRRAGGSERDVRRSRGWFRTRSRDALR
jgi:membrane protein DedA with SNARE-associated domain